METAYTIMPSGMLAGSLYFRVTADTDFDPWHTLETIRTHPTTQPKIIAIIESSAKDNLIETLIEELRSDGHYLIVLITYAEIVTRLWHLVDRVVLRTSISHYNGVPAHEVYMYYHPNREDDHIIPYVSPLGSQHTALYAYTDKGHYSRLTDWACRCPYPVRIVSKAP